MKDLSLPLRIVAEQKTIAGITRDYRLIIEVFLILSQALKNTSLV